MSENNEIKDMKVNEELLDEVTRRCRCRFRRRKRHRSLLGKNNCPQRS